MDWREYIEKNTGEVSVLVVAESLDIPKDEVMDFCAKHHGARYVGGTSRFLMWKEDAEELGKQKRQEDQS
jgi:viroplasmin and RNaseH domain-containing protein